MQRSLVLACTIPALAAVLPAQAAWTQLNPAVQPSGRTNTAAAADLSGLFTFGGNIGSATYVDELWRYDGTTWNQLTPAASTPPSPRINHCAAFDVARNRLVVFGGWDGTTVYGDTWEWDGANWTQMTPAVSPPPRRFVEMVYDLGSGRCLLFGGWDNSQNYNDTWTWDGINWTLLTPANSPSPRSRHAMAYNRRTGETMLCGGQVGGSASTGLTDTWTWNGNDWQQVVTSTQPGGSRLIQSVMAYDVARDRMVLHGGYNGAYLSDTWEFDGVDWVFRGVTAGHEHAGHAMDYVLGLGKTVSFGGFYSAAGVPATFKQETWEYQTNAFATYVIAGTGCAGSVGVPALNPTSLPWIDTTVGVDVTGLAPTAVPFMLIGLSNTSFPGGSLPFPLTAFGAPQCNLLVSNDTATFMLNLGGSASWSFALPNNLALIGQPFHNQCIALEPGAGGSFTIAASNRGDAVIGAL